MRERPMLTAMTIQPAALVAARTALQWFAILSAASSGFK
jgi:hypothetical protein